MYVTTTPPSLSYRPYLERSSSQVLFLFQDDMRVPGSVSPCRIGGPVYEMKVGDGNVIGEGTLGGVEQCVCGGESCCCAYVYSLAHICMYFKHTNQSAYITICIPQ